MNAQTIVFPKFSDYVSSGDHVEIEHEGFTLRATMYHDPDMGPPWEEHDGHGPVSDWTGRPKRPGERVLARDRDNYRYYDFQAAMAQSRAEGWGGPYPYRTLGIACVAAVEADFRSLKAWCNDEWHWCGVAVTVWKDDTCLTGEYEHAVWGIEANHPDSDNRYLSEVASDQAAAALKAARAKVQAIAGAAPEPVREPTTYASILSDAREHFTDAMDTLKANKEDTEETLREAYDEAIESVIPTMNQTLVEILASDLTLGYPDDSSIMSDGGNIFSAIQRSIEESLRAALRSAYDTAVEEAEEREGSDAFMWEVIEVLNRKDLARDADFQGFCQNMHGSSTAEQAAEEWKRTQND